MTERAPAMTARGALTYQDYAALPDDGKRYEIHDGELWELPGPNLLHHRQAPRAGITRLALGPRSPRPGPAPRARARPARRRPSPESARPSPSIVPDPPRPGRAP